MATDTSLPPQEPQGAAAGPDKKASPLRLTVVLLVILALQVEVVRSVIATLLTLLPLEVGTGVLQSLLEWAGLAGMAVLGLLILLRLSGRWLPARQSASMPEDFLEGISRFHLALVIVLFCGVAFAWLATRSFWIDEAMLALAVKGTDSHWGNSLALYEQATPFGHYLLSQLLLANFGNSDIWLRVPSMAIFFCALLLAMSLMRDVRLRVLLLLLVFAAPDVARYATEYKHYIFEFAFALVIVAAWLEGGTRVGSRLYMGAILLSIFFTYSVVFVVFAIFLHEAAVRWQQNRTAWRRWVVAHAVYGALFLSFHLLHVRPSTALQLANWREAYQPGLLSLHWSEPAVWLKLPVALYQALGRKSAVLLLAGFVAAACLFSAARPQLSARTLKLLQAGGLACGVIYLASLAGLYPINDVRHFLFAAPLFFVLLASVMSDLSRFDIRIFLALAGFGIAIAAISHAHFPYRFQESRALLHRSAHAVNVVFVGGQPAFDWYVTDAYGIKPPVSGRINAISATRLNADPSVERMPVLLAAPGAWPWLWSLRQQNLFPVYLDWLARVARGKGSANILFMHDAGFLQHFLARLPAGCSYALVDADRGSVIVNINCRA